MRRLLLASAIILCACAADTEVVLELDAVASLRAEGRRVEIRTDGGTMEERAIDVAESSWPLRGQITPAAGSGAFTVIATLLDGSGTLLATQRVTTRFSPSVSRTLRLTFDDGCGECGEDENCVTGACVGACIGEVTSSPVWRDCADVDAGTDGGADSGTDSGVDGGVDVGPIDGGADAPDVFDGGCHRRTEPLVEYTFEGGSLESTGSITETALSLALPPAGVERVPGGLRFDGTDGAIVESSVLPTDIFDRAFASDGSFAFEAVITFGPPVPGTEWPAFRQIAQFRVSREDPMSGAVRGPQVWIGQTAPNVAGSGPDGPGGQIIVSVLNACGDRGATPFFSTYDLEFDGPVHILYQHTGVDELTGVDRLYLNGEAVELFSPAAAQNRWQVCFDDSLGLPRVRPRAPTQARRTPRWELIDGETRWVVLGSDDTDQGPRSLEWNGTIHYLALFGDPLSEDEIRSRACAE